MAHTLNHDQRSLSELISSSKTQRAWVVFTGQTDLPWLRVLKSGFRHCYVIINDGDHWISIDPMACHTEVMVHHIAPDFDLPRWLRSRNLTVVRAQIEPQTTCAPWGLYSCVESVKRILGLHDLLIQTPYQLYKCLTRSEAVQLNPIASAMMQGA